MASINQHWYSLNQGISYPVDESASNVADDGSYLPSDILIDLQLRYPNLLGAYAFLSAVAITETLVTLAFQVASTLTDGAIFSPLAVFSAAKPIPEGRQLALIAQYPGVGGWLVLGSGVRDTAYRGRFSGPKQSLLAPRAARPYGLLPLTGAKNILADSLLSGVVKLLAEPPLEIVADQREIGGKLRNVAVIRLSQDAEASGFPVPAKFEQLVPGGPQSILSIFTGPCGSRPESKTCGQPAPIEAINDVAPDCNGVITLDFRGCATVAHILDGCGVAVDCNFGLSDACLPPKIPNSAGLLPDEYPLPKQHHVTTPPPPVPVVQTSESGFPQGLLPYTDCFRHLVATNFAVYEGLWAIGDEPPVNSDPERICDVPLGSLPGDHIPYYTSNTAADRNVTVWQGFDHTTLDRRVTTDLKLIDGPDGANHNGGIVLNFRPSPDFPTQSIYFIAELDYDSQAFTLQRFNGTNFTPIVSVEVQGIALFDWYRIIAEVRGGVGAGLTAITLQLKGITDPSVSVVLGPVIVNNYQPSTGRNGFGTFQAITRFAFFRVEALI